LVYIFLHFYVFVDRHKSNKFVCICFFLLYALHFFSVIKTVYVRLSHKKDYFLAYLGYIFLVYYITNVLYKKNQHSTF